MIRELTYLVYKYSVVNSGNELTSKFYYDDCGLFNINGELSYNWREKNIVNPYIYKSFAGASMRHVYDYNSFTGKTIIKLPKGYL